MKRVSIALAAAISMISLGVLAAPDGGTKAPALKKSSPFARQQPSPDPSTKMHKLFADAFVKNRGFGITRMFTVDELVSPTVQIDAMTYRPTNVQLVSLLLHELPVVYTSPQPIIEPAEERPKEERPTRALMRDEKTALTKLRGGRDVFTNTNGKAPMAMGALRAQSSCLKCHAVQEGELLGALTYSLEEVTGAEKVGGTPRMIRIVNPPPHKR